MTARRIFLPIDFIPVTIRPDADNTDGSWTTDSGGTTLFAALDETVADDADYIQSALRPSNDLCKIGLSDPSGTMTEPMKVRYRYKKDLAGDGSIELRVRLLQGTTQITSWTHSNIAASFVTAEQTLSSGEFASITDFTDLYLEFRGNQT